VAKATKELLADGAADAEQNQSASSATGDLQSLLHELDMPVFEPHAAAVSGEQAVANQNLPLDADEQLLDAQLAVLSDAPLTADSPVPRSSDPNSVVAAEPAPSTANAAPNLATRAITHVPESEWFDVTLGMLNADDTAVDPRARLAWRFKAASAANKLLGPLCPSKEERAELAASLRKYEVTLREEAGPAPAGAKQVTDALHAQLSKDASAQLDRTLTKLEDKLLAIDELVSDDAFRMRWNKERETPKALLRYARLLAARRFNVGYRRDRFEALAQELLTVKQPGGALQLMPRNKAGPVLQQLLRALPRTATAVTERAASVGYLRDALDRLQHLNGTKQFFDSGFFLDVHGYKVSMHDQITNPEFLYLCVATNVEIHNRLCSWSSKAAPDGKQDGKHSATAGAAASAAPTLAALQAQLRAQEQAVQAVFANFRKPIASGPPAAAPATTKKHAKAKRERAYTAGGSSSVLRFVAAAVLLSLALGANLYTSGVLSFSEAPTNLSSAELHALSPLLLRATLKAKRTHLEGLLSRPAWRRLEPRERRTAAAALAKKLSDLGVLHAEIFAFRTRAIEIDFGTVVYVDDTK